MAMAICVAMRINKSRSSWVKALGRRLARLRVPKIRLAVMSGTRQPERNPSARKRPLMRCS